MTADEWLTDKEGVITYPLIDYRIQLAHGTTIAVQLRFVDREPEVGTPVLVSQFVTTPDQARALAQSLIEAADRAARPRKPEEPAH